MKPDDSKFDKLEAIANEACKAAKDSDDLKEQAVNWGDLWCVNVEWVCTKENEYWRVTIDEASPDAWKFKEFIQQYLFANGYPDTQVETEW